MGFSHHQAQSAASQYDTVQQALDSLLAGLGLCHFTYRLLIICHQHLIPAHTHECL